MTADLIDDDNADIAIIGLACRMPGANDAETFWKNLAGGVESITRFTDEEILASGVPPAELASSNYVKAGAVIDEPGGFDAAFFGYVPGEAMIMDPQHRLILELAFSALEDAGCDPARYPGRVGVYSGASMNTYFMHARLDRQYSSDYIPTLIVNDKDFLSTRISYKLNLKGPSMTVQTACSTSLVALHLARQSLLSEEIDLALAGAVAVHAPHRAGYLADGGGVASPDGRVRAFDATANGTLFGSGGGVVVLKRLRDAIADGDSIRAIIKGSAVNNDGSEKAGYTAPSVNSQADAIVEAMANAGVEADSISYIEAHGSGTPVGDPIEIRALTKAFRSSTQRSGFCPIGTVKTNVGHLDAAAGMAGLIKTVLALQHRQIPPSLNYTRSNPEIDFPATPFFVNTQLTPWNPDGPRRAGLMSTGMGGTNAHVVLEEAPEIPPAAPAPGPKLFVFSARTESALATAAGNLAAFLETHPETNLDDAAFTLQTGRRPMAHRRFVVGNDPATIVAALSAAPKRQTTGVSREGARRPLVFLLPGVGDHYVGMGRELYHAYPAFRREVDRCAEILRPHLGLDIRDLLYPKNRDWSKSAGKQGLDLKKMLAGNVQAPEDADTLRLNQAIHVQPALFTIEYALASLWKDLGLTPDAIVGHSMGEYVAACLAGVFSLEDALRLIVRRTQLVDPLPAAAMMAVSLPEAEVQPMLPDGVSISLINGPSLCIVAGPPPAIEELGHSLTERGLLFRMVQNTHAFHSRVLDPIVGTFEAEVRQVRLSRPKTPFISNVTGHWITDAEATDPAYWARHLNHTARFNDALHTLWQMESPLILEVGPGRTLGVLANQHPARAAEDAPMAISSLRHHYENQPDSETLLQSIGKLWVLGATVRWEKLPSAEVRRKVSLPTYPFERQNYWLEAGPLTHEKSRPSPSSTEMLEFERWFHVLSWERTAFTGEPSPASSNDGTHWLVFSDRLGNDHGFRDAAGCAGCEFIRLGHDVRGYDDYLELFRRIKAAQPSAIHIVHLGCVEYAADASTPASRESAPEYGFFSLLHIAQAIGELNIEIPVKIAVVSSGFHQVIGNEELNPSNAAVLGPCGVIPREFPQITCFNVDLTGSHQGGLVSDHHCRWIVAEFAQPVSGEILAYRHSFRWRRTYVPVTLPAVSTPADGQQTPRADRLRDGGVYLITGGTGGIGLAVARHLAGACRAKLVLTKKTPFPAKAQWKTLLDQPETPPEITRTLRQIMEIEALGASVEIMTADVSDRDAMRQVLKATRERFGGLHGVIQAAGIVRPGLIQTRTRDVVDSVMAPKVAGTWNLHDLLAGADLDFLVLFSSITAVITPFAESDYSGANAFLDAFAHFSQAERPYRVVSINWPGWKEAGQLVDLVPASGTESWKEAALKKAIRTADGVEAFQRALSSNFPQVVVSPTNLEEERRMEDGAGLSSSGGSEPIETAGDDVEGVVREIWCKAFGLRQIGADERFTELGGHSLLALQIVTRIRAMYGVDIALRDFFEASTISQLSSLIQDKLIADIANLTDEEVQQLIANETERHD